MSGEHAINALRDAYAEGRIDIDRFEAAVAWALDPEGKQHELDAKRDGLNVQLEVLERRLNEFRRSLPERSERPKKNVGASFEGKGDA